jgi:hypothetical protein
MPFFQPDRKPSIQHPTGHAVEVITSHKPTGEIKILYFRIEDDRQERFTFQVSNSHLRKSHDYIETYDCTYEAYGKRNSIVLVFDVIRMLWMVG